MRDAKKAQLQRAARAPNARADPDFRDACTQGMVGEQPGKPGRSGECRVGRWELCMKGLTQEHNKTKSFAPPLGREGVYSVPRGATLPW